MKLGERLKDKYEVTKEQEKLDSENLTLDAIKKIFLSQRFITLFLRSLIVFEDWALKSLERLLYVLEMKTFSKGEHIFSQGDSAKGFYIIFKGDVLITHKLNAKYREKLDVQKTQVKSPIMSHSESLAFEQNDDKHEVNIVHDMNNFDIYRTMYHTVVNNAKKVHTTSKEVEIKVIGSGQLLGIEDAILKSSNKKIADFRYTAIAK